VGDWTVSKPRNERWVRHRYRRTHPGVRRVSCQRSQWWFGQAATTELPAHCVFIPAPPSQSSKFGRLLKAWPATTRHPQTHHNTCSPGCGPCRWGPLRERT